jgi:hypothetical protein
MKKKIIVFLVFLLIACNSTPVSTPTTGSLIQINNETITPVSTSTTAFIQTNTPIPSKTPTIYSSPVYTHTPAPTLTHPRGKLILHAANDDILYNWFSYVPMYISRDKKVHIWVTSETTMPMNDYEKLTDQIRSAAEFEAAIADKYNYVLLTLAIPRPETNHIYVIAYNRKVFLPATLPVYQRPDLELNKMIDQLIDILRQDRYDVEEKVFIDGYSAGCMFAQRYALLHPDRLIALAGGQCGGSLTLPDPNYDWPVGIQDYEQLTSSIFDDVEYKKLPQLFYIGDLDNKNSTVQVGNTDVFSYSQILTLFSNFGEQDPQRLENQVKQMNLLGFSNVYFKLYPGVGHEYNDQMINDTFEFFDKFR